MSTRLGAAAVAEPATELRQSGAPSAAPATSRSISAIGLESDQLRARFWAKVEKTDGCWIWTASTSGRGYGQFFLYKDGGRPYMGLAHRVSYELTVGAIPEGLTIDHLCRNKLCVNPAHLEPVTLRENVQRGPRPPKTHCPKGHPYDTVHSWRSSRTSTVQYARRCTICRREQAQERQKRIARSRG